VGISVVGAVPVVVVSPYPLLCEGVRHALAGTEFSVSGEAPDLASAVAAVRRVRPEVVLVDGDLPGGGVAGVRELLRVEPRATVLVLADRSADADVVDAVRAGAIGFLDKDVETGYLPGVIRAALAGEAVVPRRLVGRLLNEVRSRSAAPGIGWSPVPLTRREFEVLDLVRAGLTTSGIAERLFVSPGTVRSHVMSMMRKLHVGDRESLVRCVGDPSWQPPVAAL
jgi:DNA-binding NarL/FixJ family response regulator